MSLPRRQFIKTGLVGAMALGVAGKLAAGRPVDGFIPSMADNDLIAALSRGMLGALPATAAIAHTDHVLKAIAGLPLASQRELRELFDLLQQPLARRALGLSPGWHQATAEEVAAMLQRWRFSRLLLLRSAYQGLHSLLYAAWYGDDHSWAGIGYALPASIKGYIHE